MAARLDLTGQRFGKLVALRRVPDAKRGYWVVRCDCGTVKTADVSHLRAGTSSACRPCSNTTHGGAYSPTWATWRDMKARCLRKAHPAYSRYGGRGITVCRRWLASFEAFREDMGERPSARHSIERKNNDRGYTRANCCWATRKQQARNRSSNTRLAHLGRTLSLTEWSEETGIHVGTIHGRLERGWSTADALETPPATMTARLLTYRGSTRPLTYWSERTGISYDLLHQRLLLGWRPSRVLTLPARKRP
jgi:hypothetical protein